MPNLADVLHDQAITDAIQAMRYEAGLSRRVLAHIRGLGKDLVELAMAGDLTSQRKLKDLMHMAQEIAGDRYSAAEGVYNDEIRQFTTLQADRTIAALNGAVKVDLFSMSLTSAQTNAIASNVLVEGAVMGDWWAAQAADTVFKFSNIIRGGMVEGKTGDAMAREVRALMNTSMRNAQTLVRTSVITTNNAAHMAAYDANSDIVEGVTWSATLDQRSCQMCGSLDGRTWGLNEPHPTPSIHFSCRCSLIAKTKSWETLAREAHGNSTLARKLDEMDEGTRSSMDGQVSSKLTYTDWLGSKSPEFQKSILGPGRYNLLQKGKLTLRDLTDQTGNELTLKQLAAL